MEEKRPFASRSRCEKPLGRSVSPRDEGAGGVRMAVVGVLRTVEGNGPAVGVRNRCRWRSVREAAPSLAGKRGARCPNRPFRSPAHPGYGTPKRGYSPRSRVRQLPRWGHRGRAAGAILAASTFCEQAPSSDFPRHDTPKPVSSKSVATQLGELGSRHRATTNGTPRPTCAIKRATIPCSAILISASLSTLGIDFLSLFAPA